MMKKIGLTGSIAMGKTDTARLFMEEGVPVFDADSIVHELYSKGGKAVSAVERLCPRAVVAGAVDRQRLSTEIDVDPGLLHQLETVVHPLVKGELNAFLDRERRKNTPLVVVDVPLLFETGGLADYDAIIVVTAPAEIQRRRALARPGMTDAKLDRILARQLPDAQKKARADYIVDTSSGHEFARSQVKEIVAHMISSYKPATG